MNNLKLSVITTVYNVENYLQESLDSVFNQTFKKFELIIVNDGSTDATRDIALKYLKRPNVRILENRYNEGIPVSRNRALLAAKGEYIAIHDGDDISLPTRFQQEVDFLDSHPDIDFIGSHAIKIDHTGSVMGYMSYPPPDTASAFMVINRYKLNPIIDPSCMYRRKVILNHGGYTMNPELRTALDFHLWCRLLVSGCKMANIQQPLIHYRINPKGVTRTESETMRKTTDMIWASFRKKEFDPVVLKPEIYTQECFTEIYHNNTT